MRVDRGSGHGGRIVQRRRGGPKARGHPASRPYALPPAGGGRRRAPPGETAMIGSARTPRRHESAVRWTVPVSAARHHAERRAGKGTPTSGQSSRWGPAQPAAGGRREEPRVGGRPSQPGPRVQRHPDGRVVRAFRCASRSGAGPHRENWPEVGVPLRPAPSGPVGSARGAAFSQQGWCGTHVGRAPRRRGGFRAHARSWAALLGRVSRSRAMPVGDRRSMLYAIGARGVRAWGCIFTARVVRYARSRG